MAPYWEAVVLNFSICFNTWCWPFGLKRVVIKVKHVHIIIKSCVDGVCIDILYILGPSLPQEDNSSYFSDSRHKAFVGAWGVNILEKECDTYGIISGWVLLSLLNNMLSPAWVVYNEMEGWLWMMRRILKEAAIANFKKLFHHNALTKITKDL
jgi:hypothetical protein